MHEVIYLVTSAVFVAPGEVIHLHTSKSKTFTEFVKFKEIIYVFYKHTWSQSTVCLVAANYRAQRGSGN